jgi:hypothetical protein
MTSCAIIREATSAAPKATAMCERAMHAAKSQRRKCAATNSGASGRQQSQAICSQAKDGSVTRTRGCNDTRTTSDVEGDELSACGWLSDSCRSMVLAACMTTLSGCERSVGGEGAVGVHALIFQPKYWKASRNLTRPRGLLSPQTGHNAAHPRILR